jgi:hypothetical protein
MGRSRQALVVRSTEITGPIRSLAASSSGILQ